MVNDLFNIVKLSVPFERYCNDKGLVFNGSDKAICPFHDDRNPSFHNYSTHGFCFSCYKKADVIDLESHFEGLSPWEAMLSIAKRYGVSLPDLSQKDKDKFNRKLEACKLIERLVKYAYKEIKKNPEAMEFLKKKELDKTDIDMHKIGYIEDNNPIATNLKDDTDIKIALEIGLIHKNNNGSYYDHFRNRIIMPVWNSGRIVYLTGRAYPDSTITENNPKYLHLRNSDLVYRQIAFSEKLNKKDCIVTEGVFDAIAFNKVGFNSCALLGTNPGEYAKQQLSNAKAKRYFCFDNDEAGEESSYKLSRQFKGYVVNLGNDKDPDELLAELGFDEFKKLAERSIESSKYYLDVVIEKEDCIQALKEISNLDMESEKETWINKLSEKYNISKRALKNDLKTLSQEGQKRTDESEPLDPLSEYSEDEIEKAKELLNDPDLLDKIIKQISKNRHTGEEINKKILVLSFTSRKFDEASSNIVKAESASGKNVLVKAVLNVFPRSEYKEFTRITPQSLYYLKDLDLSHKILIIFESHGSEKADYSIRSSISEGELRLLVTAKNPKTDSLEAKEIVVPAKGLSYVETTTKSRINPENQTRFFDLYLDTSEEQTRKIFKTQSALYDKELIEKENRPYQALQLLLQPYDVYIPYGGVLADVFPAGKPRTRRDYPRFQTLIKAYCLLYQNQRDKKEINGKTYLLATIDDYKTAYELSQVVLSQTLKEITPKQQRILEAIKKHFSDSEFAQRDVRELDELKDINPRTLKDEIVSLKETGYLEHNGKEGKNSRYELINIPQEMLKLPTPKKLLSMFDVRMSQSQKSESFHGVSSDYWDMSEKCPNVPIEEDSDIGTELGHVPKNASNPPKLLDNEQFGHWDMESIKENFSTKGNWGMGLPKIIKINNDTYKIGYLDSEGKPCIRIITPESVEFEAIKRLYEERQRS
ncbi:toprim domain-containing protein [Desulfobacterota bacterium AH_259_B03_O07]|nr:toprim domain-containing protein [Desulfobacterota bacterium AH_259_B03_O07]